MATAVGREGQPAGKIVSWLSKVFTLNASGPAWPRAVLLLNVALVPLVVFAAIGYEQHLLSALFGLLLAALADPGAATGRARRASAPLRCSAQRTRGCHG